ncbi:MAG: hypothetical protein E7317_09185, partial [Clostridiales bacterium]|nr:hypothetical protein [Clostridiales bacterium]
MKTKRNMQNAHPYSLPTARRICAWLLTLVMLLSCVPAGFAEEVAEAAQKAAAQTEEVEAPKAKSAEPAAAEKAEQPKAAEPAEKPQEKAAEKPAEKSEEKQEEKPAEKPAEAASSSEAEKPVEQPQTSDDAKTPTAAEEPQGQTAEPAGDDAGQDAEGEKSGEESKTDVGTEPTDAPEQTDAPETDATEEPLSDATPEPTATPDPDATPEPTLTPEPTAVPSTSDLANLVKQVTVVVDGERTSKSAKTWTLQPDKDYAFEIVFEETETRMFDVASTLTYQLPSGLKVYDAKPNDDALRAKGHAKVRSDAGSLSDATYEIDNDGTVRMRWTDASALAPEVRSSITLNVVAQVRDGTESLSFGNHVNKQIEFVRPVVETPEPTEVPEPAETQEPTQEPAPEATEEASAEATIVTFVTGEGATVYVNGEAVGETVAVSEGVLTFEVVMAEGYGLVGVSVNETSIESADGAYTIEIPEDGDIAVTIQTVNEQAAQIVVTYAAEEGGSVTVTEEAYDPENVEVALTGSEAVADEGFMFVNWTDAEGDVVSDEALFLPAVETIGEGAAFTANFTSAYPAVTLTQTMADGTVITVEAPEGALPVGVEMRAEKVTSQEVIAAVLKQSYNLTDEQAWEAAGYVIEDDRVDEFVAAYDICFYLPEDPDTEIEPQTEVSVKYEHVSIELERGESIEVYHVDEDANAELYSSSTGGRSSDLDVNFDANTFSIYAAAKSGVGATSSGSGNTDLSPYVFVSAPTKRSRTNTSLTSEDGWYDGLIYA